MRALATVPWAGVTVSNLGLAPSFTRNVTQFPRSNSSWMVADRGM